MMEMADGEDLTIEKQQFRRILASIRDPRLWEEFSSFAYEEMALQDGRKRKPVITLAPKIKSYFKTPTWESIRSRCFWLICLMILQSFSGIILQQYSDMLNEHIIIAMFVTTLVGSGGNAGNQSGSLVITALSTGELLPRTSNIARLLKKELPSALIISSIMAATFFFRVFLASDDFQAGMALSFSMFFIIFISIQLGALTPILLGVLGIDVASAAAPLLATCMDLVGITVACLVCSSFLPPKSHVTPPMAGIPITIED
eukprot:TRINITY_DN8823_c0_g1_i1.p1 TRINITY_DN8823_c0_g1~~TRINITY_DN8823_c0_g1_i1.p1  ORF type:complete len:259 (-),score=56.74 TRINITY_DN8823_c0_g1_i1:98-874(-)